VIFAVLHALAALKHHFIDRDATLTRMLGRKA
jgi:cytochrome b561